MWWIELTKYWGRLEEMAWGARIHWRIYRACSKIRVVYIGWDLAETASIMTWSTWFKISSPNRRWNPEIAGEILKSQMKSWNRGWNPEITDEIMKSRVKSWNPDEILKSQVKSWNHRWNLKITGVKSEIMRKLKSRTPDRAVSDPSDHVDAQRSLDSNQTSFWTLLVLLQTGAAYISCFKCF